MSSTALGGGESRGARARLLDLGQRLLPWVERFAERVSQRAPELALIAFGLALRVKAIENYWYELGYDYGAHEANVLWWAKHVEMPPLELSRGSYHPQLYYILGALLLRAGGDMLSVQILSAVTGCARLLLFWWAAERYVSDRLARILALALAVGMPAALEMDANVTQESMNNLLALAFLIAVLKLCSTPDGRRLWPTVGVGVLAGLGLLLKMSNFVLLGVLGVAAGLELVQRQAPSFGRRVLRLRAWVAAGVIALAMAMPQYVYNHNNYGKAVMDGWYKRPTADTIAAKAEQKVLLDRRSLGFVFGFTPEIFRFPYYPVGSYPTGRFWTILIASTYCDHFNFGFAPPYDRGGKIGVPLNSIRTFIGANATKWARASIASGVVIALIVGVSWLIAMLRLLFRREVARPVALMMPALGLAGALYFAIQYPYDFEGVVKGHYLHFVSPPLYALFGLSVAFLLRHRALAPLGWIGAACVVAPGVYSTLCVFR